MIICNNHANTNNFRVILRVTFFNRINIHAIKNLGTLTRVNNTKLRKFTKSTHNIKNSNQIITILQQNSIKTYQFPNKNPKHFHSRSQHFSCSHNFLRENSGSKENHTKNPSVIDIKILEFKMGKEAGIVSKEKVAIIGSGNWGSVVARIVGNNVERHTDFHREVRMWVFEELIEGRKLTEIINEQHENVKYLPGFKIPKNVVAVSDLLDATRDATSLIFVMPHQFVHDVCNKLKGHTHPKAKAISLIKGFNTTESGIQPISQLIEEFLQFPVCTLSGANIANEIAEEKFSETTIGYEFREEGELFKKLLETKYFRVGLVNDVVGVELCGALKNVIAIGAGIIDGLKMGDNTKAAIIRMGVLEMKSFIQRFYKGIKDETFFHSCGLADVITSCYGGRNRKVAEAHVTTGKPFDQLEKELLNGQKLQGTLTAKELNRVIVHEGLKDEFKLFTAIYRIVFENLPPQKIFDCIV